MSASRTITSKILLDSHLKAFNYFFWILRETGLIKKMTFYEITHNTAKEFYGARITSTLKSF